MTYVLGIDLGTTFSAAAVARDGRAEMVTLGTRSASIPSVVVLHPHGDVLVGEAAERRAAAEPTRTAREFKRRLGDPVPIVLGGEQYGAEALMAHLLRWIVERVTELEGGPPDLIVISHPANYGSYKKELLFEAVRLADVAPIDLITEPEAAAVHYAGLSRVEDGEVVAVYDFGGGTFDAAVVRKGAAGFELIGTPEGMERFGGIDFDQAVLAHVQDSLGGVLEDLDPNDPAVLTGIARLRDESRDAKEALSSDTDATIPVMLPNVQTEVRLTRSEFESMIRPRLNETVAALERAVRSAGIDMAGVSKVLLVGGSSRIPLVSDVVKEATGRPVAVDAHPKHSIALGAATAGLAKLQPAPAPAPAPVSAPSTPALSTPAPAAPASPAAPAASASPVAAASASPASGGKSKVPLIAAGVGAFVVAAAVIFALTSGGGGGGGDTASSTTSAPAPANGGSTAPTAYPAGSTDRFNDFCGDQGVPGAVCTCAIDGIKTQMTYPEFVSFENKLYANPDDPMPTNVTKIFEDCTERNKS